MADENEKQMFKIRKNPILPRQYSWTLKPKLAPHLMEWFRNINYDTSKQVIHLSVYETQKAEAHLWIKSLKNKNEEILDLSTFDGMGNELYNLVFYDIKLKEQICCFDYTSPDVVQHNIILSYGCVGEKVYKE